MGNTRDGGELAALPGCIFHLKSCLRPQAHHQDSAGHVHSERDHQEERASLPPSQRGDSSAAEGWDTPPREAFVEDGEQEAPHVGPPSCHLREVPSSGE